MDYGGTNIDKGGLNTAKDISEQMRLLNQAYKETDEIYYNYAKEYGISETAFWVLYSLWDRDSAYTQRDFCVEWYYSPKTIHSALKVLETQGLIELALTPGNRKNKQILFTAKGKALAEKVIAPIMQAEQDSFSDLEETERELLLSVTQKRIALLKSRTNKILKSSSEDRLPQ